MTHRGPLTDAHDRFFAGLELLAPLMKVPSWVSPEELRGDPTWASLRNDPLFSRPVH